MDMIDSDSEKKHFKPLNTPEEVKPDIDRVMIDIKPSIEELDTALLKTVVKSEKQSPAKVKLEKMGDMEPSYGKKSISLPMCNENSEDRSSSNASQLKQKQKVCELSDFFKV